MIEGYSVALGYSPRVDNVLFLTMVMPRRQQAVACTVPVRFISVFGTTMFPIGILIRDNYVPVRDNYVPVRGPHSADLS